jgi:hypothetical protein
LKRWVAKASRIAVQSAWLRAGLSHKRITELVMRDLLRSTEGEITSGEFRRGAKFLAFLTLGVIVLFLAVRQLSLSMEWMTVAVAPFIGLVVLFVICSLIYFWYCVFIKRLRALGQSLLLLNAWLAAMFIASAARLIDYQNRTLELSQSGPLVYAGFLAIVMSVLSVILFVILLVRCWRENS